MWTLRKTGVSVIFLAALGLAACGGGGGGGGDGSDDSTSSTLTESNSGDVAGGTYTTSNSLASSGSSQTDSYVSAAEFSQDSAGGVGATHKVIQRVLSDVAERSGSDDFVTAVDSEGVYQCNSGDPGEYEIVQNNDPDPNVLEAGDEYEIDFRDCGLSTLTIDGTFNFTVDSVSNKSNIGDTSSSTDWSYTVTLTYTSWTFSGSVELVLDGSMTLTYQYDTSKDDTIATVSGGPLTFETGTTSNKLSKLDIVLRQDASNATPYTLKADYTSEYDGDNFSGTVTVDTDDNDRLIDDGRTSAGGTDDNRFPDTGKVTITDQDGNKSILDASQCGNDGFQVTYKASDGATTSECESWI